MNFNVSLSPVALLALFSVGMVELGLIYWLYRDLPVSVSEGEPLRAARATPNYIIVPLDNSPSSSEAVEVACRLASDRRAELMFVHVLEQSEVSTEAPMAAESRARHLLDAGQRVAGRHDLKAESRVIRDGGAPEAILALARETGAEMIVTGAGTGTRWSPVGIERTADELFRNASCQVVVVSALRAA